MDKHCANCIYRCYITAGRTLHREKDSSTHPAESKREAKGCI